MKRAHRRSHLLIWLLLVPALAAILLVSLQVRPEEPAELNPSLPPFLLDEAS